MTHHVLNLCNILLFEGATDWVKRWKHNGWKTANGTEVLNKEDVVRLDSLCGRVDVQWVIRKLFINKRLKNLV